MNIRHRVLEWYTKKALPRFVTRPLNISPDKTIHQLLGAVRNRAREWTSRNTLRPFTNPPFAITAQTTPRQLLRKLHREPLSWLDKDSVLPFARHSLDVVTDKEDDWYCSARHGFYAYRVLERYMTLGRGHEIMDLIEPIDWRPLEAALKLGKGAIVVTAHNGPTPASIEAMDNCGFSLLSVSGSSKVTEFDASLVGVATRQGRKKSLIRCMLHLRDGGVVFGAADGRHGDSFQTTDFLNQKIKVFTGFGELARLTRAPTIFLAATWVDVDRIRITLEPFSPDSEASPEQWTRQWYSIYLNKLARQMRESPADLGFQNGVWRASLGGLDWLQSGGAGRPFHLIRNFNRKLGLKRAWSSLMRDDGIDELES